MAKIFSLKIYFVLRILFAVVFLYSGISKLLSPADFALVISGYGILPDAIIPFAAITIPVVEILVAAGLCFDIKGSLTFYSLMIIVFMAVLFHGISMGLDVDCGCFGPEDPEGKAFHSLKEALLRDGAIFAGCLYLYAVRAVRGIRPVAVGRMLARIKS
jgi:uncharacterized membrane protein YphA (DoxX/SURF4 family)